MKMDQATQWERPVAVTNFLAKKLNSSRISIVLGAGVSSDFKLPSWDQLLSKLDPDNLMPPDFDTLDETQKATLIKSKVYNDSNDKFLEAVHTALYFGYKKDFRELAKNPLLSSLGALLMRSSRGSVTDVITFNFDDVLETYLGYFGFSSDSPTSAISWVSNKDVVVHHPHGILRFDKSQKSSNSIVLDSSSFHEVMKESNPWRQKIYHILSSSFVIFIGVSGSDKHLMSQLEDCKKHHIAMQKPSLPYWGLWFTKDKDSAVANIWRNKNVLPYQVEHWDDVPDLLFKICQKSAGTKGA